MLPDNFESPAVILPWRPEQVPSFIDSEVIKTKMDEPEAEKKYIHAVSILEQATELNSHENVDIVFANGSDALPFIGLIPVLFFHLLKVFTVRSSYHISVLASISDFIKKYLIEMSCSYEDPCIVIPNLLKEDFMTFKRFLTSRVSLDVSYHIKKSEVASLCKVFQQFGVACDEMFEDLALSEGHQEAPSSRKSFFLPNAKRVPSILSKSSQASNDFWEDDSIHYEEDENDDEEVDDTSDIVPEQISGDPLSCSYCSKKYSHAKGRNKHMINEHLKLCKRDGLCHPCSSCPALFVTMAGRDKHVKRMHPSPTETLPHTSGFRCQFCEEKPPAVFQK